jgi:hypothetical protein
MTMDMTNQMEGIFRLVRFMILTLLSLCLGRYHKVMLTCARSNNHRLGGAATTSGSAFVTLTSEVRPYDCLVYDRSPLKLLH